MPNSDDQPDVPESYAVQVAAMADTNNGTLVSKMKGYRPQSRADVQVVQRRDLMTPRSPS